MSSSPTYIVFLLLRYVLLLSLLFYLMQYRVPNILRDISLPCTLFYTFNVSLFLFKRNVKIKLQHLIKWHTNYITFCIFTLPNINASYKVSK